MMIFNALKFCHLPKIGRFLTDATEPNGSPLVEDPEILNESLQCVLKIIRENGYNITVKQTLAIVEEVYAYSNAYPKSDCDVTGLA
jgi:hypothetical protein